MSRTAYVHHAWAKRKEGDRMVKTLACQQVNRGVVGSIPSLTLSSQFDKKNRTESQSLSDETINRGPVFERMQNILRTR